MEFVTIHELSRLSGVSTATIRLDIKAGKLPVASPGKKGRGNPTRIRVTDLNDAERILYRQLAKHLGDYDEDSSEMITKDLGKLTVNELSMHTGLSPQVIRKDILDGKLRADGGGRRGSPYYILSENLSEAKRIEYRRMVEKTTRDFQLKSTSEEIERLKIDVEQMKERLQLMESRLEELTPEQRGQFYDSLSEHSVEKTDTIEIPIAEIQLPEIYQDYYISEDKLKQIKAKIRNHIQLDPIILRPLPEGGYQLRKGIAEYHVAKEMGLSFIQAVITVDDK